MVAEGSKLTNAQISRYSRQLLVPSLGVDGQVALLAASVLVVGAGGLGCAVLPYLAGAGVGRLGIVDFDDVDVSNLHRQVIYREDEQGTGKAAAAAAHVAALNVGVGLDIHRTQLGPENALALVEAYDVVVDASDNPRTRYVLNDACVLAAKPLVFGSAIGTEGQVSVFNHAGGPCYRCVFPQPFAHEAARRCSDNGVLGPVVGAVGSLQAMEAIKVITGSKSTLSGSLLVCNLEDPTFYKANLRGRRADCAVCGSAGASSACASSRDGATNKIAGSGGASKYGASSVGGTNSNGASSNSAGSSNGASGDVESSSDKPSSSDGAGDNDGASSSGGASSNGGCSSSNSASSDSRTGVAGSSGRGTIRTMADSAAFCDAHGLDVCRRPPPPPTPPPPAVTCAEYAAVRRSGTRHVLLDVRVPVQFAVCRLPGAVSLPLAALPARLEEVAAAAGGRGGGRGGDGDRDGNGSRHGSSSDDSGSGSGGNGGGGGDPVYCLCRRGVDSAYAAALLVAAGFEKVYDVKGGLVEWSRSVDETYPIY